MRVRVWVRKSRIAGLGLFAAQEIKHGTRILPYLGEKIAKAESTRRLAQGNAYIFTFNDRYDIDGKILRNTARYINHSCDPNCDVTLTTRTIWIVALRDIRDGEELTPRVVSGPPFSGAGCPPSVAPAAQHPPLARRARRRLAVRAGPGCRRCRASALGALPVAGRRRQGGRRRRWKRACQRPPVRASRGREARRATRWPGVCQGRRAGRGYQREQRAGRREKWLYFSYTLYGHGLPQHVLWDTERRA